MFLIIATLLVAVFISFDVIGLLMFHDFSINSQHRSAMMTMTSDFECVM